MKNTKLVWRLGNLPSVEELRDLVRDKIISQDESRQILFNLETVEDRDTKSLQSEIKFLRELVEKLSIGRSQIITTIKEIEVPYRKWDWYRPYGIWSTIDLGTCTTTEYGNGMSSGGTCIVNADATLAAFSDIKTF